MRCKHCNQFSRFEVCRRCEIRHRNMSLMGFPVEVTTVNEELSLDSRASMVQDVADTPTNLGRDEDLSSDTSSDDSNEDGQSDGDLSTHPSLPDLDMTRRVQAAMSDDDTYTYTGLSDDDTLTDDEDDYTTLYDTDAGLEAAISPFDMDDGFTLGDTRPQEILTDKLPNHVCCNCGRSSYHFHDVYTVNLTPAKIKEWKSHRRSKRRFCYIQFSNYTDDDDLESAMICDECKEYLDTDNLKKLKHDNVWPAFVWQALRDGKLIRNTWLLLPELWREWWYDAVAQRYGLSELFLRAQSVLCNEVSTDLYADIEALKELKWCSHIMKREESLTFPTVKCVAGCSEWKHKAKSIPLDIVFEECLQTTLDLYSCVDYRQCTNIFRKDFLLGDSIFASKRPGWQIKPSIAIMLDTKLPVFLTCRHHDVTSKSMMLHPPRSPLGTLSTKDANQYAPVVAIPRTVRTAKTEHTYSASYHMAMLEGNYFGLDTMYLSSDGGSQTCQSELAWKQDLLAFAGRPDMKEHMHLMYRQQTYPRSLLQKMQRESDFYFPTWHTDKHQYTSGSSCVMSEGAMNLFTAIKYKGVETCLLSPQPNGRRRQITFKGGWPQVLVWVHPTDDRHGKCLPSIPPLSSDRSIDTRGGWLLFGLLMYIPELWSIVTASAKREDRWEGWVLTALTKRCLPHQLSGASENCPFKSNITYSKLMSEYIQPVQQDVYDANQLRQKFLSSIGQPNTYGAVVVQQNMPDFASAAIATADVLIVLRQEDLQPPTNNDWRPGDQTICASNWELRFLATTTHAETYPNTWSGIIYYRHGGEAHPGWWKQDRRDAKPVAMSVYGPSPILNRSDTATWTACVYVRKGRYTADASRRAMLAACGGQASVYCVHHRCPLVTTYQKMAYSCTCYKDVILNPFVQPERSLSHACCTQNGTFNCPVVGCKSCICKFHFAQVSNSSSLYYIGRTPSDLIVEPNDLPLNGNQGYQNIQEIANMSAADEESDVDDEVWVAEMLDTDCNDISPGQLRHLGEHSFLDNNCAVDLRDPALYTREIFDGFFVTDTQETHDVEDVDLSNIHIPTTNASLRPVYSVIDHDGVYSRNVTTNHVLLNKIGSCLVRRNRSCPGTLRQKSFLQGLVSRSSQNSIPLLYPEGMMFTNQFHSSSADGSVAGALPAAFLNNDNVLKSCGMATLHDHYRTRMSNIGLLCSTNPKYHFFAFDSLVNLGLRGCDSRVILRRGFADYQKPGGVRFMGAKDPIMDTEQIDSRPIVNKLSAAIAADQPTYFYTHTCSMKTHFGVRLLWEWLHSDDFYDEIIPADCSSSEQERLKKDAIESAGTILLRIYMEMIHIWILYITKSPEQPLGKIGWHFERMELQDAVGNLPHMHCIFWTDDNLTTQHGVEAALDRIRGNVEDILRQNEREDFIRDGLFKDHQDVNNFLAMMKTLLQHKHRLRCFAVVKDASNSNTDGPAVKLICKSPDNYALNPSPSEHTFKSVEVKHTQEAIRVMMAVGVAKPNSSPYGPLVFEPLIESLRATRHIPPAHRHDNLMSPVPGPLVARNPNTSNIQFTTGYFLSRYLAKYVASVDSYNVVSISPTKQSSNDDRHDGSTLHCHAELQLNSKITGNRMHRKKTAPSNNRPNKTHTARAINVMETYMYLFGYDFVYTNIPFVEIVTQPYEERRAMERIKPIVQIMKDNPAFRQDNIQSVALTAADTLPCHHARLTFKRWRQFMPNQIRKATDDLHSGLTTDRVTVFGMRPPELIFVMHQAYYFRWFTLHKAKRTLAEALRFCTSQLHKTDLRRSAWIAIDGTVIRLRHKAIRELLPYAISLPPECFAPNESLRRQCAIKQSILALLHQIDDAIYFQETGTQRYQESRRRLVPDMLLRATYRRFITPKSSNEGSLPVVWHRSVKPTQPIKFLIHLLLSMGAFVDEYSLFQFPTIRESFIYARLLDPNNPEQSTNDLIKQYITHQLSVLPAGTHTFDNYCVEAYNTVKALFVDSRIYSSSIPSCLYCRLTEETDDSAKTYLHQRKVTLARSMLDKLHEPSCGALPTLQQVMTCTSTTPLNWNMTCLQQPPSQPNSSYQQQQAFLRFANQVIHDYQSVPLYCTNSVCIVGAGGVGKTTVMLIVLFHAMCRGLNVAITSILSERSRELAGDHLASLICMPRNYNLSVGQRAERCISRLYQNPDKLLFIQTLDVLGFDEAGVCSGEELAVLDIVLRYVRNSDKPFGGILLVATLDHLQIDPCKGRHVLLSTLFITTFTFHRLTESVRAADDIAFQQLQAITRLPPSELAKDHIKAEFVRLFCENCSFVTQEEVDAMAPSFLFVFGKNSPIRKEEQKLFQRLRNDASAEYIVSTSNDFERTITGAFVPASPPTTAALDHKVKEPHELFFYKGGRYQITGNKKNTYSNSQLAVLFELPTQQQVDAKLPIRMILAPPGCRYIPSASDTEEYLLGMGWTAEYVGKCRDDQPVNLHSGIRANRTQYQLRHHIGSTNHAIMGQTLGSLVTKVTRAKGSDYSLWLPAQVRVLLSRTKRASHTYFISDNAEETANILYDVLNQETCFQSYISGLVDELCRDPLHRTEHAPVQINLSRSIFRPRDITFPNDNNGQVYILISIRDMKWTYIGSTTNLHKRYNDHNAGIGSQQTAPRSLRPWALVAYVTGFGGDTAGLEAFENKWIELKQQQIRSRRIRLSVEGIVNLAIDTMHYFRRATFYDQLRLVRCGTIELITQT